MAKLRQRWISFSSRLTRRIVMVVLAVMLVVAALITSFTVIGMGLQMEDHYQGIVEFTNEKLSSLLSTVEISANNNVDELEQNLGSPKEVFDALARELQLNPHVTGFGFAFVPDYFPSQGTYFEPYVKQENGEIVQRQIGGPDHDYLLAEWYTKTVELDAGHWSDPYVDNEGAQDMLCTYALPVKDSKGKLAGVLGTDISLGWLRDQLAENDRKENERARRSDNTATPDGEDSRIYSFIIGRYGEYLAHPDEDRVLVDHFYRHLDSEISAVKNRELVQSMIDGERGNTNVVIDGVKSHILYAPLVRTGWSMAIVVPIEMIYTPGVAIGLVILFLLMVGLLIVSFMCRRIIRKATRPLTYLAQSAEEVAQGHFDTPLPVIRYNDEIRQLRDSFANMQQSLGEYIQQLTSATASQAAMESELDIARDIQMSMLPKTFPPYPERSDIDLYGQLTPAKAVGGDLYDFHIRDEKLFFCIGDVSGKGVPASLVMAMTSAQLRTMSSGEDHPERIVSTLNKAEASRNESMMFVTLFVGVLDLKTGKLQYCNAGHNAPILVTPDGNPSFIQVDSNLPVGVVPEWSYTVQEMILAPGSALLLYTDGLSEAENPEQALFGEDRILETLRGAASTDPTALVSRLSDAVHHFVNGAEQSDDLTLLAIRYR